MFAVSAIIRAVSAFIRVSQLQFAFSAAAPRPKRRRHSANNALGRTNHAVRVPRNVQTAEDRSKLVYRVKVSADNASGTLKAGMPVEAEIPFR